MNLVKIANLNGIKIIDGDRGKNYPTKNELMDNGFCLFLNTGNVTKNGFNFENNKFISEEKDGILRNGKLKINDIVMTTRGTVGNLALYNNAINFRNLRINSGMVILRPDIDKIHPKFLLYSLKCDFVQDQISSIKTGSAQPQLPISLLKEINIYITDIKEQQAIADVLSSFDDKIELNNKIIKNLEEQAQSLYKHWFVDFEFPDKDGKPYKSNGGKFKESELGLIPEDWGIKTLGTFFPVITGKQNANIANKEGIYPFFSCSQDILYCNNYSFDDSAILLAGNGDFSVKVYSGKFEAYQRTYVLIPTDEKKIGFLYYSIKINLQDITKGFRGSVIKFITKGNIENYKIIYNQSSEQLFEYFNSNIKKVNDLKTENQKLAEMRDYLLPKLMNGEIKVNEIKQ